MNHSAFSPLRAGVLLGALYASCASAGCGHTQGAYATTQSPLALSRVVLYRNGVGYFERHGVIDGDKLTLKVRKDQVNDLLKSLTVIDRSSGKALSVSIPLDPQAWQDAALSLLMPGRGRLADVLDGLRGVHVSVETASRTVHGRIVMVERMNPEPRPEPLRMPTPEYEDHKLTLLDGDALQIVKVSQIRSISLEEGDLVMQLDRHLDATSGEGMFQQVEVVVRLSDEGKHDLAVSYVAAAPLWKPTYRVVLAQDGSGKALLQAWAVVSNVSGESWDKVSLGLTSGAPLAFRYDLHTPENVERPDLTQSAVRKQAQVAFGETTYAPPAPAAPPPPPAAEPMAAELSQDEKKESAEMDAAAVGGAGAMAPMASMGMRHKMVAPAKDARADLAAVDMGALARSVAPRATAKQVAGLTRFDLAEQVTLPDGSASMVALVNQLVPGEQTFLYRPGGSGLGYEQNPYRVVRFKNDTDFVLEPGPISIYAGGSFVGEGLSEAIASHDMATIPFAAEPSVLVRSSTESSGDAMKITKIVRGVMEVQAFHRVTTTWSVQGPASDAGFRVLVRQGRAGDDYTLVDPPKDTETLADGYFIPVVVAPKQTTATLPVIEQTPSQTTLTIWDDHAPELLKQLLETPGLDAKARAALEPIVQARQEIGRIDTQLQGLSAQQAQLDQRANEERQNLSAIQKDARASALRKRLTQRLEELSKQAEEIGRKLVELNSQRLEHKIELEDKLRDLDFTPAMPVAPAAH